MAPKIVKLSAEHHETPLGIQTASPRLSWRFGGDDKDWLQAGYEIHVKRDGRSVEEFSVQSDENVLVDWPSAPLESRESALVRVRARGQDGEWTEWAELGVEAGLLERQDWASLPITCSDQHLDQPKRPFRLRWTFEVPKAGDARLYITAFGLYEAYLNGHRIGDHCLAPGWTSYHSRVAYQTFDITPLLQAGENIFGAWVGEGWYAGRLGYGGGTRNIYGPRPALVAQIEIGKAVPHGGSWEWSHGAVVSSEIYDGETYDSRLPDADFRQGDWKPSETLPLPEVEFVSSQSPPIRERVAIKPIEIITTPLGKTVVDFGQNQAGVVRIRSTPPSDASELIIRHAEVLEHGELGVRPLRGAKATDRVVLGGHDVKGYMPRFTFHGYRYAEISGWRGLTLDDVEAVVLQTSMERTGTFSCSHDLINRLHENCVWSTVANTIGVPTDCPQRDERLGWTGDVCVFSPTMSYLFNSSGFLAEWAKDLWLDQQRLDGIVPIFVPDTGTDASFPEAIWGDAAVLVPYDTFVASADRGLLQRHFESIAMWLDKGVLRRPDRLWSREQDQLADWLAPMASPHTPNMGPTDNHLVADAWLIHSTRIAAAIAKTIGRVDCATRYNRDADALTKAFYDEYVTPSGRLVSETQTALCLLLHFGISPRKTCGHSVDYRALFAQRLGQLVAKANWLVDTGFAGTPIILQTLADNGHLDHAYRMLQAKQCPSWLATVLLGATSIWERWDSMLADGTVNPGEMTSFNHYALGSVASFMHSYIGGLSPLSAGWREILIHPQPGGTITSATTSHTGPHGEITASWEVLEGEMRLHIKVPPNCSAKVVLPGREELVGSGERDFAVPFTMPSFPPRSYIPHFAPIRPNEWV